MAQINITFNTTAAQDAKLAKALAYVNANRVAPIGSPPLDPYPTVTDWFKDIIVERAKATVQEQTDREDETRRSAFRDATAQQKAQIDAILGIS